MGFRVSPGVSVKEIDLTTVVPAVATTPGGFAGYFHWGPCKQIVTVSSEKELVEIFQEIVSDHYCKSRQVTELGLFRKKAALVQSNQTHLILLTPAVLFAQWVQQHQALPELIQLGLAVRL